MLKTLATRVKDYKTNLVKLVDQTENDLKEVQELLSPETKKVKESTAPRGSFEELRDKLQLALSTNYQTLFPKASYGPYICCVYTSSVIVETGDNYYNIPYQYDGTTVTYGQPVGVDKTFVLKESSVRGNPVLDKKLKPKDLLTELKESNIEIVETAQDKDFDLGDFISLREAKYDANTGEVEVVLIEAGTNPKKKRHYPVATIQEAAPLFSGLKMYLNHPTKTEEREIPERDITKWASTIIESHYDNGKAIGRVVVHDKWLRERLNDPVARAHIGLSINTGGRLSRGKVDGEEMEIVEKIVLQRSNGPASVDWVTEAGARGRVSRLLKESNNEEEDMDFTKLDLATLKKERPDLIEAANRDVKESGAADQKDKDLKEAQAENARLKKENALRDQKDTINGLLKESKLPESAKARVIKELNVNLFESEVKLKEAVEVAVKNELEYINQFSPKGKIKLGSDAGKGSNLIESMQNDLDKRAGVLAKKDEETEE